MQLFLHAAILASAVAVPLLAQVPIAGRWQGEITREGKSWPVTADIVREDSATHAWLDFGAYGVYYRRASLQRNDSTVLIRLVTGRDTLTFSGSQRDTVVSGRWTGLGLMATFELRRTGDAPGRLVEEQVHFINGDVSLAGRLVKPAGTGPWPAIVWTHGSGRQSRDEDFYRDRAYLLAREGIASLIYDKRGVAESSGDPDATLHELAGDAVAAVSYMRGRSDIRPRHVGIGGFSQGGYVAPLAAMRYGQIAFVVVGSAPGVSPAEQNDFTALSALQRMRVADSDIHAAMQLRADVAHFQRSGAGRESLETRLTSAQSQPWFRAAALPVPPLQQLGARGVGVLDFDPLAAWRRVNVPVLGIWGENDQLVPAAESKRLIEDAMPSSTRARATLQLFPLASHGLLVAATPGAPWDWPRLAPGFHELLTTWIGDRVAAMGSR